MLYIHWKKLSTLMEISNFIEIMKKEDGRSVEGHLDNLRSKGRRNKMLLWDYLDSPSPLHNRRTLDQYRYHNLEDTRDRDQTLVSGPRTGGSRG